MSIDDASKGIGTGIGIAAMGIGLGIAFDAMKGVGQKIKKHKTMSFKPPKIPKYKKIRWRY
jgi:hypothetical protein